MKKTGVYILLLIFILHNTALDQILKLPVLVAHYHEHQQLNGDISIMDFLCMHYWGKDIRDKDYERDMQLPYKTVDIHTITHSFIPLVRTTDIKFNDIQLEEIVYPLLKNNYMPDPALSALFRPPQA
ncbi:hypothetical protein GO495_06960 [Chitinophaga oryziterrae]|uniref:Uncharacterized protein n=1 Tax=Chitinophaga oryziterrae TaxID=1031224 RepID=A0A6N8J4Y5_9BACT|nr:hypothetical protein [Chitinophaga oryziterrae]MVT40315.1 hypothetical protein [Chitinophaga oryziterrae]